MRKEGGREEVREGEKRGEEREEWEGKGVKR